MYSKLRFGLGFLALFLSPIAAQAADSAPANTDYTLQEVTVTAQFVKQNLQDTPVAITAVNAAMLEARGQQTVEQIASQAPNVTLTSGGAFAGPAMIGFIRGVGQTDFNPALEPGVGLYVDDVYYSTLTGSILDLLDLDRVEVLRGPQGTLSGKNSIGGAIKLYSKRPGNENDGYVEAAYGSYSAVTVRGASSFTLVPDRLYARVSGVSRSRSGYITRLDYQCTHPGSALGLPSYVPGPSCVLGKDGGIRYTAARLAVRWLPTDRLEFNFSADAVNDESGAPANVTLGVGPTIAPVIVGSSIWPTVAIPPTLGSTLGCRFIAYGPSSCDPNSPNNPYVNYSTYIDPRTGVSVTPNQTVDSRGLSLNIDWQLAETLQLQSITAYRRYTSGFANDADGTPFPLQMLYQKLGHTQKSQEFRLNGKWGSRLDYTLGGFYFDQTTTFDARVDLGYVGFDFLHGPDPVDAKTWALFAHGIFHVTDQLDLSAGVRYSDDKKDYTYFRHNPNGGNIQPCLGPPGTPGNPPNCLISTLNGTATSFQGTRTDYRAVLSYKFTPDLMAYAQLSTGYKGGGVNPRPFYNVQAVSFKPETLDAVEVGLKSELLDNRLRMNVALFANKYKDIQLTLNNCTALFGPVFGVPCLLNSNAGDADVKGAELEFDWYPVHGLQVDGSLSYLDFKFTKINPVTGLDLKKKTPYSPKQKASLGVQYEFALAGGGTLTPRVDMSYQGVVFSDAQNTPLGTIASYTLLNAKLMWRSDSKDWQLSVEGQNLADKLYYSTKTDQTPALGGSAYGTPGLPRTVMFSVKRSF